MRIQFKKLLPLVQKYDKDATMDILFEVWASVSEEHRQFIIDSLKVIENKGDYEIGENAAAYKNISQYAKMTKEFRKQNEFIEVLNDESKEVSVDKKGNLVVS